MKTIGVIGGMGPEATLDLFRKIIDTTPARRDQDHLHVMIDNFPQIPDRTAYLLGEGESPLSKLITSARTLVEGGASALCMPCNTAHYFVEEIRKEVSVPFISIVESTFVEIAACHPGAKKIGLMSTRGTIRGRVYHEKVAGRNLEILSTSESFQEEMMEIIYSVKGGRLNEMKDRFQACLDEMEKMGADVVIAGCTEIPLLLPRVEPKIPVIDPTLALAKSVVRFAGGDNHREAEN